VLHLQDDDPETNFERMTLGIYLQFSGKFHFTYINLLEYHTYEECSMYFILYNYEYNAAAAAVLQLLYGAQGPVKFRHLTLFLDSSLTVFQHFPILMNTLT
jgi:hypothetical protein